MEDPVDSNEELRRKNNLEKFATLEEILADWEPSVRVPGGRLCSVEELFEIVDGKCPKLFPSPDSVRDFIVSRPHFFRLSLTDTVRVRIQEETTEYIDVVRFVREKKSVTRQEIIKKIWPSEWKKMKMKMEEKDEDVENNEASLRKMLGCGPWRKSPVWQSIKRGGDGIFEVDENDSISLTTEALQEESFFDDVYYGWSDEVVRRMHKKMEDAEDETSVRKQRQCNSTQITFLAVAREVKIQYLKALILSPNYHHSNTQTIYILPNQIGQPPNAVFHMGQMLLVRAHEVIGDESLKNRFRADEIRPFLLPDLMQVMRPKVCLGQKWLDDLVHKHISFPHSLRFHVGAPLRGEKQSEELTRLLAETQSEVRVSSGLTENRGTFSELPIPTRKMQEYYDGAASYESVFVMEMDNLIQCGIKKVNECRLLEDGDSYPIDELLHDLKSRTLINPHSIPLVDEETMEELVKELQLRPHLYYVHDGCLSVSLSSQREAIDSLLHLLDSQAIWTYDAFTAALAKGLAGEGWLDNPVASLLGTLHPLVRIQEDVITLGMRHHNGVWIRDESALRRGTKRGEGREVDWEEVWRLEEDEEEEEEVVVKKCVPAPDQDLLEERALIEMMTPMEETPREQRVPLVETIEEMERMVMKDDDSEEDYEYTDEDEEETSSCSD